MLKGQKLQDNSSFWELNEENRNNLAELVKDHPNFEMEFKYEAEP